jgi:serine/threonine protein phosphatase 1
MSRRFACSDLHGRLDLYYKIKEFIAPTDKVYFLGDAIDRGPEPWKTFKVMYEDPQFIMLKGNHEDMLVKAGKDYLNNKNTFDVQVSISNGGEKTLQEWSMENNPEEWLNKIALLPVEIVIKNNHSQVLSLTHAGYTPKGRTLTDEQLIWDRDHVFDNWRKAAHKIIIHGHTPIPHLIRQFDKYSLLYDNFPYHLQKINGALRYCDNHKIDIDCGLPLGKNTVLLNLDTLEDYLIF